MIDKKIIAYGVLLLSFPLEVGAIPPPDILLSGLQSLVQMFGVIAVFFVSAFFLAKDLIFQFWHNHRRWSWALIGGFALFVAGGIYYSLFYAFTG